MISKYISYQEAIKSQTAERLGIENKPNDTQLFNMKRVARTCFDPIREFVGGALFVSSFFRCEELNKAIGGSRSSDHCQGNAIDIDADIFGNGTNKLIFNFCRENLEFDQLIWEFGNDLNPAWVHISLRENNRKQVLKAYKENGATKYELVN